MSILFFSPFTFKSHHFLHCFFCILVVLSAKKKCLPIRTHHWAHVSQNEILCCVFEKRKDRIRIYHNIIFLPIENARNALPHTVRLCLWFVVRLWLNMGLQLFDGKMSRFSSLFCMISSLFEHLEQIFCYQISKLKSKNSIEDFFRHRSKSKKKPCWIMACYE